jgi:hypothetical protein
MKNLRYISAQPATLYYVWQVETMINNFISMGINPNNIDIVCWKQNGIIPEDWSKLANHYPCRFLFYDDTRETKHYISSIRPNILKQHWDRFPELKDEIIFYHDSDIMFTKPPSQWITNEMIEDDKWYGSDTRWYIGHNYILSKGEDILQAMCDIMKLEPEFIKERELNSIGAQYLMKGIDSKFWHKVEIDSEKLFKDITELNNQKLLVDPKYHTLQIWCSDMWSVLWNGWKLGYETITHPNFDFSWATSSQEDYNKMNIMHNAGVTNDSSGLFYKANWMNSLPYNIAPEPTKETSSWYYWNEIQKTAKKSCII